MGPASPILLAADDPDFALLIQLGFQEAGILNPVRVVKDGCEALKYLSGEEQYRNRRIFPLPSLILLDTRLRLVTGFEVLQWKRQQPGLGEISVLMFLSLGTETETRLAREIAEFRISSSSRVVAAER